MNTFIKALSAKLNISESDWNQYTTTQSVNVPLDSTFYKTYKEIEKVKKVFDVETSDYSLQFANISEGLLELCVIIVNNPGKGLGTEIMNHILDTSDELNITIKTVPAPIKDVSEIFFGNSKHQDFEIVKRLRKYYFSLGFRYSITSKAVMFYKPEK